MGYLGEIHPQVADNYGIGDKTYVAVLDMPVVVKYADFDRKFTGIARFPPAVTRDLSMVVPHEILAGDIEDMIVQRGGKILESYQLFDVYEGSQIKAGYKSMAYSVVFRAKDKTLEESEINNSHEEDPERSFFHGNRASSVRKIKMNIYVIRHGQTPWNVERRLQGRSDTDLNEIGREMAIETGKCFSEGTF